jgi:hypothetical protein
MPGGSGGRRSRNASQEHDQQAPAAWVNAGNQKIDYNVKFLLSGEKASF